ncbi:hypothetical protein [Novosphingobium decolorationis]|uniref:Uncharacterized protein n=1 Tax=Novosphingobium decolorationis TaxID=2698673 RepID=A0ABX8E4G4_9SPHN|nr:hypothetical protein [Novosphingobium decolorationis]QVM83894.1 hypothetical protein HT578_09485 [Novosphingobium decolorationis]
MRYSFRAAALAGLAGLAALPAQAQDFTVKVSGRTMPWSPAINKDMDFGIRDGTRPAMLFGASLIAGSTITFRAHGETTTLPGGARFGPEGQIDYVTEKRPGGSGRLFPSYYLDKADYPAHLNALIGAFVSADGKVIGAPFLIGRETARQVPEGAQAITFGINDDVFHENEGELLVEVHVPEARVILEQEQAQ